MSANRNGTGEGLAALGYPGFGNTGTRSVIGGGGGGGNGDSSTMPPHIEAAFCKEDNEVVEA
jgi:hypothetical protein